MAGVTITVDDADVRGLLDRIAEFGERGLREALVDIGAHLWRATRDRAVAEVAPDGTPWHALSPGYAARKAKRRAGVGMLTWDWHMLGDRLTYQVEDDAMELGTSAKYGAIHQFGGKPDMAPGPAAIPARPWLGLSDQDEREVIEILREHLDAAIGG